MKLLANGQFPLHHLQQRECFVSDTPTLVSTILGSCLAVTMFDPVFCIGGICHAFLPSVADYSEVGEPCRYVDTAIWHLLQSFGRRGIPRSRLEIKMFGGGEVMSGAEQEALVGANIRMRIGARNLARAREVLREEGLTTMASDVGGGYGRKLLFLTHTGGVWIKRWGRETSEARVGSVIG